jgi:hypothetical protein
MVSLCLKKGSIQYSQSPAMTSWFELIIMGLRKFLPAPVMLF